MGPTVDEALGRGEVHPLEELADLGAHVGARGLAVQQQGTFEVVADAVEGVQGGEGVLEDHLDVVAVASQGPAAGADRGATQGDRRSEARRVGKARTSRERPSGASTTSSATR